MNYFVNKVPQQIQGSSNKYVIHNKSFLNKKANSAFLYYDMYLNSYINTLCQTRIVIPNFKKTPNLQLFT